MRQVKSDTGSSSLVAFQGMLESIARVVQSIPTQLRLAALCVLSALVVAVYFFGRGDFGIVPAIVVGAILLFFVAVLTLTRQRSVPEIPETAVSTSTYVDEVIRLSQTAGLSSICLFSSEIKSRETEGIDKLQDIWGRSRADIRVLAEYSTRSLRGACELHARGIAVRFVMEGAIDLLSFHVFRVPDDPVIIMNRKSSASAGHELPVRLDNRALADLLGSYFDSLWRDALPLQHMLAKALLQAPGANLGTRLDDIRSLTSVDPGLLASAELEAHFLSHAKFIFVVGLPGTGKTLVRRHIASFLRERNIACKSISDYVFLFSEFIKELLKLSRESTRFEVDGRGAFRVSHDEAFTDATQRVRDVCLCHSLDDEIVVAELARSSYTQTFGHLGNDICNKAVIVRVVADEDERMARLSMRAKEPTIESSEREVRITPSDDHYVSEAALQQLYASDDLDRVARSDAWKGRVFEINTSTVAKEDVTHRVTTLMHDLGRRAN